MTATGDVPTRLEGEGRRKRKRPSSPSGLRLWLQCRGLSWGLVGIRLLLNRRGRSGIGSVVWRPGRADRPHLRRGVCVWQPMVCTVRWSDGGGGWQGRKGRVARGGRTGVLAIEVGRASSLGLSWSSSSVVSYSVQLKEMGDGGELGGGGRRRQARSDREVMSETLVESQAHLPYAVQTSTLIRPGRDRARGNFQPPPQTSHNNY